MIPGLSTLKTWGLALLAGIAALATIMYQREKVKRIEDEHEDVQNAQRVEQQDAKITAEGLTNEARTREEVKKTSITDYFKKK